MLPVRLPDVAEELVDLPGLRDPYRLAEFGVVPDYLDPRPVPAISSARKV